MFAFNSDNVVYNSRFYLDLKKKKCDSLCAIIPGIVIANKYFRDRQLLVNYELVTENRSKSITLIVPALFVKKKEHQVFKL